MSCARGALVAGFLLACSGLATAGGRALGARNEVPFGVPFPKVAMPGILEVSGKEARAATPALLPVNRPATPGGIGEASGGSSTQTPGEPKHAEPSTAVEHPSVAANPFAPWKLVPQALPACK